MSGDDTAGTPSTSSSAPPFVERLRTLAGGRVLVRYRCACGVVSAACYDAPGNAAEDEIRVHLALAHGMGDAGRCARCQRPTDYFRAHVPELGTDEWLCATHAPALPVITDQAGAPDEGPMIG